MTSEARRPATLLAAAVSLGTAALYTLYGHLQWTALIAPSWDLAIFSQLARAYSTWSAPIVPVKGAGFNLLGDHFHPLLVLLGPVWRVWPSGMALLAVQAVAFGLSAFPLTRLAARRQGQAWGAFFGLAYCLSWGLQAAAHAQFHEVAFAVPLLAFALTAHLEGRPLAAALWAAGLVFVKEDLGLTVAVLGAVLAWRGQRAVGAALAGWGAAWFLLATFVILPAVNPGGSYAYAGNIGSLAAVLGPAEKWVTLLMLATTAGVVGLRSPLALLMLPTLAWRLGGDVPAYWGWQWHYSAVLMPVAFAAMLDAVRRAPRHARLSGRHGYPDGRIARRAGGQLRRRMGRWLPPMLAAATTLALGAALPLAALLRPETYQRTWRWEPALAVVHAVPAGASVESDLTLLAHLVPRAEVYFVGNENPPPEFVLVDEYSPVWLQGAPPDAAAWAAERHGVPYELVLEVGGFQLAQRLE